MTALTPLSPISPTSEFPFAAGQDGGPDTRTDIVPLTAHILRQQHKQKDATGDLSLLLTQLAIACKWISNVVRKAELLKVLGVSGDTNVQQEAQQKLDVLSNNIMINMLRRSGKVSLLVSEEDELEILVDDGGKYCVVFDPLDGSSNIDCGVSVGTIFGIYRRVDGLDPKQSVLRPGREMVSAGYCMYGSSTVLVLTTGEKVNGYTLDPNIGEFILTHRDIKIGQKKIFSVNEGHTPTFPQPIQKYLAELKSSGKYTARYVGSMVSDMHRTLLYGGVFMYPFPKLRVLYEAFPMAMLVEVAGGMASDGRNRTLDRIPEKIHERTGIYLGSKEEVERIEELIREHNASEIKKV